MCAVPTTLSGAEMSSGHRTVAGFEDRPRVRPALVLAVPRLMASAPPELLRASAMNALGHAMESLYVPSRNPVATLAGLRAAELLAEGLESPDGGESLALGSILAGYALGSTELSLHHVVCQTIVRVCSTPHAATNAVMLPHTAEAIAGFAPVEMAPLAEALGVSPAEMPGRITELAGGGRSLRELGVQRDALDAVAEAAAREPSSTGSITRPAATSCGGCSSGLGRLNRWERGMPKGRRPRRPRLHVSGAITSKALCSDRAPAGVGIHQGQSRAARDRRRRGHRCRRAVCLRQGLGHQDNHPNQRVIEAS